MGLFCCCCPPRADEDDEKTTTQPLLKNDPAASAGPAEAASGTAYEAPAPVEVFVERSTVTDVETVESTVAEVANVHEEISKDAPVQLSQEDVPLPEVTAVKVDTPFAKDDLVQFSHKALASIPQNSQAIIADDIVVQEDYIARPQVTSLKDFEVEVHDSDAMTAAAAASAAALPAPVKIVEHPRAQKAAPTSPATAGGASNPDAHDHPVGNGVSNGLVPRLAALPEVGAEGLLSARSSGSQTSQTSGKIKSAAPTAQQLISRMNSKKKGKKRR